MMAKSEKGTFSTRFRRFDRIDKNRSRTVSDFFLMLMPLELVPFTFLSFRRSLLPTSKLPIGSLCPFQMAIHSTKTQAVISIYEESKELWDFEKDRETRNPVIESSEFAYKVEVNFFQTWICMFKFFLQGHQPGPDQR